MHLAPANAKGLLRPIHVKDLAEAIARLALAPKVEAHAREIELGGSKVMGIFEYLECLKGQKVKWRIRVPAWLARVCSHVCDLLHLTPFSFGHYELLKFDNCPAKNHLPIVLNKEPRCIGVIRTEGLVFA